MQAAIINRRTLDDVGNHRTIMPMLMETMQRLQGPRAKLELLTRAIEIVSRDPIETGLRVVILDRGNNL